MENTTNNEATYVVVKNHEDQYSLWPGYKTIPAGWIAVNDPAPKAQCLAHIQQQWTDMRPKSLR